MWPDFSHLISFQAKQNIIKTQHNTTLAHKHNLGGFDFNVSLTVNKRGSKSERVVVVAVSMAVLL